VDWTATQPHGPVFEHSQRCVFAGQRPVGVHTQLVVVYLQVCEHLRVVVAPWNPSAVQLAGLPLIMGSVVPSHCSRPLMIPSPHRPPPHFVVSNVQSDLHARPGAA
jgi:hypothetical protein